MNDARSETPSRAGLWITLTLIVVIVGAMVVVFSSRFGKDPSLIASPLIGKPASTIELPYLEQDGTFGIDELRGHVVVVNFFASWCFPCREEHPALEQVAAAYAGQNVRFVGVVYQDRREAAIEFLDQFGRAENTVYLFDPDSRAAIDYGVFGVPETFYVNPDGIIVAKKTGPSTVGELSTVIETVLRGEQPGNLNEGELQRSPTG